MNGRVVALFAVLAMFVGLWSAEHKNRSVFRENQRIARNTPASQPIPSQLLTAQSAEKHSEIAADLELPVSPCSSAAGLTSHEDSADLERQYLVNALPLPEGIVPGRYRVIDNHGDVCWVEVTPEQLAAGSGSALRDYYVKVLGEEHWIFESVAAIEVSLAEDVARQRTVETAGVATDSAKENREELLRRQFLQVQGFLESSAAWMSGAIDGFGVEPWDRLASELSTRWQLAGLLQQQTGLTATSAQQSWTTAHRQLGEWLTALKAAQTDERRQ